MSQDDESKPIEVLLVEDDPGDVVLITRGVRATTRCSTTCYVVADGVEALQFLRREGAVRGRAARRT